MCGLCVGSPSSSRCTGLDNLRFGLCGHRLVSTGVVFETNNLQHGRSCPRLSMPTRMILWVCEVHCGAFGMGWGRFEVLCWLPLSYLMRLALTYSGFGLAPFVNFLLLNWSGDLINITLTLFSYAIACFFIKMPFLIFIIVTYPNNSNLQVYF